MSEPQTLLMCDEKHGALKEQVDRLIIALEKAETNRIIDLEKIYKKLDEFGQRLPTWAVALAATGSMVIGILATKVAGGH